MKKTNNNNNNENENTIKPFLVVKQLRKKTFSKRNNIFHQQTPSSTFYQESMIKDRNFNFNGNLMKNNNFNL